MSRTRLTLSSTNLFKKHLKQAKKRGKDLNKLENIVNILIQQGALPPKARPHMLKGRWHSCWECHLEPDWLLIYQMEETRLVLIAMGSHADLFE